MKTTRALTRALLALLLVGSTLTALPAHAAEVITEDYYVETVDGALVFVQVRRDKDLEDAGEKIPVILTYSPYNILGVTDDIANDSYASRYVPRGYARAVADVIGTRNSTGCWDYGGPKEQQSGVDLVNFLASRDWSNGNVAMIGGSYDGTTATMVAARGDDAPGLKAIVPIAGISHWYGYAYYGGVRYFLNSKVASDEGFDTPLLFDFALGRVPSKDTNNQEEMQKAWEDRLNPCDSVEHTQEGYSRSPDYDEFWLERDYLKDAPNFRAAALIAHGWQDYNVKQDEAIKLWNALPVDDPETEEVEGVPFKRLWMSQGSHGGATGGGPWQPLLDRFFAQTLKGEDTDVDEEAPVFTLGRTVSGAASEGSLEPSWPPPGTKDLTLHLGRSFDQIPGVPSVGPVGTTGETGTLELEPQDDGGGWTHVNPGTVSEEATLEDPLNEDGHGYYSLYHKSAPLDEDTRLVGSAILDTWVNTPVPGQTVTPILVEVDPQGNLTLVERGFLNLDYAGGLAQADAKTGWIHARVEFLPQDYTFRAGSRIGLILQGSNTVWAVPGNPGALSYAMGPVANVTPVGAQLILPTTTDDPFGVAPEEEAPGNSGFGRSHKKFR